MKILPESGMAGKVLHLSEDVAFQRIFSLAFVLAGLISLFWTHDHLVGNLIGAAFAGVGVYMFWAASSYETMADARSRTVSVERRGLRSDETLTLPFDAIAAVEFVNGRVDTNSEHASFYAFCVRLRPKRGESIPLSSYMSLGRQEKRRAAELLAQLIDVPLESKKED